MIRFVFCALVFGALCGSAALSAQARPDLSGTWIPPTGLPVSIAQTADRITVTTNSETRTYNLDGSTTRFRRETTATTLTSGAVDVGFQMQRTKADGASGHSELNRGRSH